MDPVTYTAHKAWKALHFAMRVLKKRNRNTKFSLHVIGTSYSWIWVSMMGSVQRTDKWFRQNWEKILNLQIIRRVLTEKPCLSRDRWRRPYYLCRIPHVRKIRDRKQRRDIENYSFVNKTIESWDQISTETLGLTLINLRFIEKELGKQL